MISRDTLTHGWVCGWLCESVGQWVGSGQITNNLINLDLIKIIQLWTFFWTFYLNHLGPLWGYFLKSFLNLQNMWFKSRDYLLKKKHIARKVTLQEMSNYC